jgi:hypothetical protein
MSRLREGCKETLQLAARCIISIALKREHAKQGEIGGRLAGGVADLQPTWPGARDAWPTREPL